MHSPRLGWPPSTARRSGSPRACRTFLGAPLPEGVPPSSSGMLHDLLAPSHTRSCDTLPFIPPQRAQSVGCQDSAVGGREGTLSLLSPAIFCPRWCTATSHASNCPNAIKTQAIFCVSATSRVHHPRCSFTLGTKTTWSCMSSTPASCGRLRRPWVLTQTHMHMHTPAKYAEGIAAS